MLLRMIIDEVKKIFRDKMYVFFVIFPLLIALVSFWLVPYLKDNVNELAAHIVSLVFILMTPFIFGAILAFSFLDDRDDHVYVSLKITPLKLSHYLLIKLVMAYIFAFFASFLILIINSYLSLSIFEKMMIALLSAISAPLFAMLINAFSHNKVEGFVIMKAMGILLMAPVASLFVFNWTELFLGLIPGFWVARLITQSFLVQDFFMSQLSYFIFGFLYHSALTIGLFFLFLKRVKK